MRHVHRVVLIAKLCNTIMKGFRGTVQRCLGQQMGDKKSNGERRFVSAQDVAERAGVSRSAVSRAFTPGASIAPATLKRVQVAADALGYQVNDLARGLLAHRSHLVGLVTSDPETPFRASMIAALSRALIERGNVPAIITIGHTPEDLANASRQLLRYRAEATIFLSGSPPAGLIELTRRNNQPLILINRAETGLDVVRCDDRGGARQAYDVLRRSGASSFAVIGMSKPSASLLAREKAFVDFASKRGITAIVARGDRSDYNGGREAARQLLANGKPPGAVFCVNDLMAFGAMDLFRTAGFDVPNDISIVGFDDIPTAAWTSYSLTTLRQDPERIAKEVVAVLDRRTADPDLPPISVSFPVDLVVRLTVKGLS
jgi:DNA-binding LacI/PurR family transcriptional regulator